MLTNKSEGSMSNEAKVMWWAIAKAVAIMAVCCAVMVGCGLQEDVDDMGIPSQVVSWPLTGGLDTGTGPLSVQPGSFLQLDDVVQERAGEWRNRNGFTQSALDTLPNGVAPLFGNLGDAGMFVMNDKLATYQPSLTSNRWTTSAGISIADDLSRVPVMSTDNPVIGFAQAGNIYLVASLDSVAPALGVFDAQGKTHAKVALPQATYIRARCAATAGKLVAYLADVSGNLVTYVVDAASGVVAGPTTIKSGLHLTAPYLDAQWDRSSATITVVARLAAADAVRFMEHNPSTGALATDVSLAAIVANSALSLFQDQSASGVRFVGVSDSTGPTTRVLRVASSGAITTNDLVDNVTSTAITGVGYSGGAFYGAVYQDTSANKFVRVAFRDGGGLHVGTARFSGNSNGTSGVTVSIDGQAWSHDGLTMQVILGIHSTATADPQDSWSTYAFSMSDVAGIVTEQSRVTPLQAQAYMLGAAATQSALFQRPGVSAHVSKFALPVLASYVLVAGVAKRQYSIDVFTQQVLGAADIGVTVNHGRPVQYKQTSFIPGNTPGFIDEGGYVPLGTPVPAPQPSGATQTTGGSLTLLATYGYVLVIETLDSDGNVWRSPPSAPALYTLTGANNQIQFNIAAAAGVRYGQRCRLKLFRTVAGGSIYRLVSIAHGGAGLYLQMVFNDTLADTAITASDVLYTAGETPTAITPRFSHMMTAKDRLWGLNADFRTEVWYSKNLRPGRQPEFTNVGVLDIDDNFGDVTGISAIDDNTVVFKRNAIYFIQGDGFNDDGSGTNFSVINASIDIGAIPGSPITQAGEVIYFVSDRGIYSIDRSGSLQFVGLPVDRYINQALIQTPERIWDACWIAAKNEVRFLTDNYILVYNRKFATTATIAANSTGAYWSRWKFAGGVRCTVINNAMVVVKSDGTVWREGDQTQLTDQGSAISGLVRMSWINAANQGGYFRLRRVRATGLRTAGGGSISPTMTVFFNGDDASFETYAPQAPITAGAQQVIADAGPRARRCTSFSAQLAFAPGDNTYRLDQWSATVAVKQGSPRDTGTAARWQ